MLAVVSGPPGAGKSTLARALADQLGVPAIIRDEIKQGMVATGSREDGYEEFNIPALHAFFDTLTVLARAGISVVAEAAFQDKLWRPNLAPQAVLHERITHRVERDPHRRAHNDIDLITEIATGTRTADSFVPVNTDLAQMTVDTTDGYQPSLDTIAGFILAPPAN